MISVIVPVYNSELYLKKCLTSIAAQTYRDLEIICINDGSTDLSADILDEFEKKDIRFRIITQSNEGVSAARNRGLELAQGEYVTFVDSDDDIDPSMYQTLIDLANKYRADIVHCGYRKIELNGSVKDVCGTKHLLIQNGIESSRCLITGKYFVGGSCTKLYCRKQISDIRFDETLKINEDVLFNFEAFIKSKCTVFFDVPLYHYYEREGSSCSTTKQLKKSLDCLQVAERIYDICFDTELEQCALDKLFYNLINTYKVYLLSGIKDSRPERNALTDRIEKVIEECNVVSKKYKYNYYLMKSCPYIYKILYKIYDKIRKPNWDI